MEGEGRGREGRGGEGRGGERGRGEGEGRGGGGGRGRERGKWVEGEKNLSNMPGPSSTEERSSLVPDHLEKLV